MPEQGSTYTFADLSGLPTSSSPISPDSNPYDVLITACADDPVCPPTPHHCPLSLLPRLTHASAYRVPHPR